jgi:hypothetical protein
LEGGVAQGAKRAKVTIHPRRKFRINLVWFGEQFWSSRFKNNKSLPTTYISTPSQSCGCNGW